MATTKVNSEFIAVNAISGTIIADGAITSTHLAANCVDSSELVTGSIDTIHIAANQVTATKIVTNGILTRHISDDQVTADKLANSINTDIATGPAALPKAGGTMTGTLNITQASTADTIKLTRSTTAQNNMIKFASDSADKWIVGQRNDSTEHFRFYSYGTSSDVLSILTDGKVGIGTTSPDRKLDVSGTGNVYGKFQSTNATGAGIEVKDTGEDWLIQADDGTGSGGLAFYDLGRTAYRMFLDASGNLGIGTTSPSQKLDVNGTVELNNLTVGGAQGSDGQVLTSTGSGVAWEDAGGGSTADADGDTKIQVEESSDEDKIRFDTAGTERLVLDNNGHLLPGANNTYDLGATATRWRNIYTNDLQLSNEQGDANEIDGTQGSWTIQEGDSDLFLINRKSGKKYKFDITEIED